MREPMLTSNYQLVSYKFARRFLIVLVVINQLFTYHQVSGRSKGLIYNRDGKFIYRPPKSNQGHIIVIDDRHRDTDKEVAQRSTSETIYQPAMQLLDQRYSAAGGSIMPANQVHLIGLADLRAGTNTDRARSAGYNHVGFYPAQVGAGGLAGTPLLAAQNSVIQPAGSNAIQLMPMVRVYQPSQLGNRIVSRPTLSHPFELVGAQYLQHNQRSMMPESDSSFDQIQQGAFMQQSLLPQRSRHLAPTNYDHSFTIDHPASVSALLDDPSAHSAPPSARSIPDIGYTEDNPPGNYEPETDEIFHRPASRHINRHTSITTPSVSNLLATSLVSEKLSRPLLLDQPASKGGRHSKQAPKSKYAEPRKQPENMEPEDMSSYWKQYRE